MRNHYSQGIARFVKIHDMRWTRPIFFDFFAEKQNLIDKMADLRGYTIDELYEWVEENKLRVHHWFYSTDLTFYVKGGRVSRVSGWFGTILQICPLLNVDVAGKLIPREKIRTKQKVMAQIIKKMEEHADGGLDYADKCFISHSGRFNEAKEVASVVQERFPNLAGLLCRNI